MAENFVKTQKDSLRKELRLKKLQTIFSEKRQGSTEKKTELREALHSNLQSERPMSDGFSTMEKQVSENWLKTN